MVSGSIVGTGYCGLLPPQIAGAVQNGKTAAERRIEVFKPSTQISNLITSIEPV